MRLYNGLACEDGVSKTKPTMKELETYFLRLTDRNRDELPLEKILRYAKVS